MFAKAVQTHRKEIAERAIKGPPIGGGELTGDAESNMKLPDTDTVEDQKHLGMHLEVGEMDSTLGDLSTKEMMKSQVCNFFLLGSSYLFVLIVALLRGGEGKPSVIGIDSCSEASWLLLLAGQVLGFALSLMAYHQNKHIYKQEDQGYDEKSKHNNSKKNLHEFHERQRLRKKILVMSYFTGIAAGTLGIGGGMILGPFMLGLGMDPNLSTALCGFTVLFTSSSTTSQFIIAGAIHLQHAWVLMFFSLIGSFIGNLILKRMIKKYNKPSLIIWVIFGILSLACLVLPAQTIYNAITKTGAFSFGAIC